MPILTRDGNYFRVWTYRDVRCWNSLVVQREMKQVCSASINPLDKHTSDKNNIYIRMKHPQRCYFWRDSKTLQKMPIRILMSDPLFNFVYFYFWFWLSCSMLPPIDLPSVIGKYKIDDKVYEMFQYTLHALPENCSFETVAMNCDANQHKIRLFQ